ncbi:hypothetical protein [Streptomyces badius]|uniref:Uncharacterized protein n=1 Tax=Streptomyces badius TaxID=1941 RepID=A0ABQ2T8E8_STRBA|nr:hypothetical protein [Streptomyces badius]GGS54772.1 hypothetical protein GCM10010253_31440 [Streptomyces badius]
MRGGIWIDWRLVGLAALGAVGGPGAAVMGDLPVVARCVLAVVGLLAWWYLFRCAADTWGARFARQDGAAHPAAALWLLFVVSFYLHAALLGAAWRACDGGEQGANLIHVLTSSALVGLASLAVRLGVVRRAARGRPAGRRSVTGALLFAVLALWPAMAVWHGLAGAGGAPCGPDAIPGWWPSWLPLG